MQSPADYEDDRHNDDDECLARDACAETKNLGIIRGIPVLRHHHEIVPSQVIQSMGLSQRAEEFPIY